MVKLTDFGIATALADDVTHAHAGTPAFMSPEHADLTGGIVETMADVLRHAEGIEAAFDASTFDLKEPLRLFVAISKGEKVPAPHLAIVDEFVRCDARLRRRRALGAIMKAELAAAAGA